MKSIKEYLPSRMNDELIVFTSRVPKALVDQVKAIAKRENVTLTEVVEACLTHFVDEMSSKKRSA